MPPAERVRSGPIGNANDRELRKIAVALAMLAAALYLFASPTSEPVPPPDLITAAKCYSLLRWSTIEERNESLTFVKGGPNFDNENNFEDLC